MRKVVFAVALCALLAAPAVADQYGTITVTELNTSPGTTMTIWSSGLDNVNGWVGVYNLQLSGANITTPLPSPGEAGMLDGKVGSFCIDIWDYSQAGAALTYDVKSLDATPDSQAGPMGDVRAAYLAQLLDTYWNSSYLTGSDINNRAAALQVAVWEIVDEGQVPNGTLPDDPAPQNWNAADTALADGTASGNFYVNNDTVAALANQLLFDVRNLGPASSFSSYVGLSSQRSPETAPPGYYQDYVVKVPVPAAVLLGMVGLGAAGIKLRKFA